MADDSPNTLPAFDALYRSQARQPILDIVEDDLAAGADADEQAQRYAEKGKPDFVLAYLLDSALPDERKRELYAVAHEQRAIYTQQRAREFDRRFHRAFPLLETEAANDRVMARRIRAGMPPGKGRGRQIPLM
ncbi:MAG TPA: hypothetical protein VFS83_19420 [Ktedonobacterales bacterium]|nr:hypothetical protein [Ktedonobacterales bacterium]